MAYYFFEFLRKVGLTFSSVSVILYVKHTFHLLKKGGCCEK